MFVSRYACAKRRQLQRGFSLVELSVILVVIAVILSISMAGRDVLVSAQGVRAYTDFVQGWVASYRSYMSTVNAQPGDNPASPVGRVVGPDGGPQLCDSPQQPSLSNAMLSYGVSIPEGRAQGMSSQYVYTDINGLPHNMSVCFATVSWAVQGPGVGLYTLVPKTVLDIRGLTPQLAWQMDALIDTHVTGNQGNLRDATLAADTSGQAKPWSELPDATMSGQSGREAQSGEVEAYLLLN